MKIQVDNAIIMAAGTSSRFAPISYERPKALISVKGEILIERQIRQLKAAGVPEIIVVTGYMKEQFLYLRKRFGVTIIENPEYSTRNNNISVRRTIILPGILLREKWRRAIMRLSLRRGSQMSGAWRRIRTVILQM